MPKQKRLCYVPAVDMKEVIEKQGEKVNGQIYYIQMVYSNEQAKLIWTEDAPEVVSDGESD